MTPLNYNSYYSKMYYFNTDGFLTYSSNISSESLRPVVSLKLGTEFIEGGTGTPTNPYVVKYD